MLPLKRNAHRLIHIVVDTSVARAASEKDKQPAKACRDSLEAIRKDERYRLAINDTLKREWLKEREEGEESSPYASRFALAWLTGMEQEGRVKTFSERKDFINQCIQASASLAAASAIQKDLHLVDLALQADQRVLSKDKKIVGHLRQLGKHVPEVCPILWVHPVDHDAPAWLAGGAPARDDCRIC
jgi:hypothetical protein